MVKTQVNTHLNKESENDFWGVLNTLYVMDKIHPDGTLVPIYEADVNSKTNKLYIKTAHVLAPFSDFDYLTKNGFNKKDVEQYIKSNNPNITNKELHKLLYNMTPSFGEVYNDGDEDNGDEDNGDEDNNKIDTNSKKRGMSLGAILGITGGVIAFILLVVFFLLSRKSRKGRSPKRK